MKIHLKKFVLALTLVCLISWLRSSVYSGSDIARADQPKTASLLTGSGRFYNTQKWRGMFTITGSGGGQGQNVSWTVNQSANGTFALTINPRTQAGWNGTFQASVSVDDSRETITPPIYTESWQGSGTDTNTADLFIDEDTCSYSLSIEPGTVPVMATFGPPPGNETVPYEWGPWGLNTAIRDTALPASGRTLNSSLRLTNVQTGAGISGNWDLTWSFECDTQGALPVTPFRQNDPRWRTELYDHSNETIWGLGCAMTSLTMAIFYVDQAIWTPSIVNSNMIAIGGYDGKGVNFPVATHNLSGGHNKFHAFHSRSTNDVDDVLCMGYPVIVAVKYHAEVVKGKSVQVPGHYVIVTGRQGSEFLISDPAFNPVSNNKTKLSQYGTFETRGFVTQTRWNRNLRQCSSNHAQQSQTSTNGDDDSSLTITAGNNVELLVVDPNGRRTGHETSTGNSLEEIPESVYFRDSLENDQTGAPPDEITHLVHIEHPAQGSYQISVIGVHQGPYSVAIEPFSQDGSPQTPTLVQGTAPVHSSTFPFRYNSTPGPVTSTVLGNISTRAFVQTGDNVMIGGFIIQGTGLKTVIVRAIGPELSAFGVPNALADPTLELHSGTGALLASNDNWQTTHIGGIIPASQVSAIQTSGHAPTQPSESAIIATLPPGNYTAIVRGKNNTTGVALVEVYDLSPTTASILGNISTRDFVQTGDNVMIGGFIVQGTTPMTVIVRAIGPELTHYGVPNALADPTLELHDASGALIASNDNWQTTHIGGIITASQVSAIQSSGHAPTNANESAIIATLQPGNYTAIVRGVNNTTGVALVEVYDLLQPFF